MKRHLIHRALCLTTLLLAASAIAQNPPAPAPAAWNAMDITKRPVSVPADKISLLLFLRPDQPQSIKTIEILNATLKGRTDIQVIGIVSGDDAEQSAVRLAAPAAKFSFPVVADTEYAASGNYGVRVWPTTVLVQKSGAGGTGVVVAHIAGLPVSFQNDLDAYLDFAAGKMDKPALDKRLAAREAVADTSDQKAARHVEVAQRLAAMSAKDDARNELNKALELKPSNSSILLAISRAQLTIGDPKSAEAILSKLSDPSLPGGEINFLKGWAALQLNRWADAKTILTEAVKLNPDPAESLYLLGLIAQHDNDMPKAAEYFRKAFEHTLPGRLLAN